MSDKKYTVIESTYPVWMHSGSNGIWLEDGCESSCDTYDTDDLDDAMGEWRRWLTGIWIDLDSGKCRNVYIVDNETGDTLEDYDTKRVHLACVNAWDGASIYRLCRTDGSVYMYDEYHTVDDLIIAAVLNEIECVEELTVMIVDTVYDDNGKSILWDAAVWAMDDDLREEIAASSDYDHDNQGFFERYAELHEERFGEQWAPFVGGAW